MMESAETISYSRVGRCIVVLILLSLTFAVYWQVREFEFVGLDDPLYILENARVRQGLTLSNLRWAFTKFDVSNWHPLTWLSYMLDVQLFGVNAGALHMVNLLLHLLNTALVFWVLQRMTGALWRSVLVAAFFGLHPLHVESVAWISERKDVLSTFFWLLTMLGYHRYSLKPTLAQYLIVFVLMLLGLMSKPMVVTLPFVLLLMDFWPLKRLRLEDAKHWWRPPFWRNTAAVNVLIEKLPFFFLIAVTCVLTIMAQKQGEAIASLENYPFGIRVANSLVAYVAYIGLTLWPANLAVIYNHPGMPYLWQLVIAVTVLAAVSFLCIRFREEHPWLLFGWLWYLGTLVPVIGLVQVGSQALADRYTYIPLLGLFIMVVWSCEALAAKKSKLVVFATGGAIGICLCWATVTYFQVGTWKTSISLFEHAIRATGGSSKAYFGLGWSLVQKNRYRASIIAYQKAIELRPNCAECYGSIGTVESMLGEYQVALGYFNKELEFSSGKGKNAARKNMAHAYLALGRYDDAIAYYLEILSTGDQMAIVHNGLGIGYSQTRQMDKALEHFRMACELEPKNEMYRGNLMRATNLFDRKTD